MKLEHRVEVAAGVEAVRAFLEDVPAAARCVPGIEEVHAVAPDQYEGKARLRLGPLGFSFAGRARLDHGEDGTWRLEGEGRDARVGAGVNARLEARLEALGPQRTEVQVVADLQFSGRLAEMGQPLIRRKADAMVEEFAENLRREFAAGEA